MPDATASRPTAVVFDLGGVLLDWNPRHLFRSVFAGDEAAMERFLAEVATPEWNAEQDRGRSWADGLALLVRDHPEHAAALEAYWTRWLETIGGPIQETVAIVAELRLGGQVRLLALTNWSAETFERARPRFAFLDWFEAIVVSGAERIIKPDPAIFAILVERHGVDPARTVYIDDTAVNVRVAADLGYDAIAFNGATALRGELTGRGLLG
ncbi:MAG: HAD family phosphatase [Chloroflexi bacterium]|nr:HAD family phosphatase [Chloroflexota bacterium]